MNMKKYIVGVFIITLLFATFATLPRVDHTEANVLFYFQNLTPLYYICVLAAIAIAIYWRRSHLGLLSAIVLGLLILLTPSIMLVQPWFPDTYAFVSEAVYVMRNGHLGDFHYLSINPPLGLFFGPFLMITGISPFALIKIYPAFITVILAVLLYLIAKKMKIGKESLVVAPLLFLSIEWPNELHICRQSFSLIFYLTSWFLLLGLVFQKPNRKIFILFVTQVFLLAMSHPATPLFFIINLASILVISQIVSKLRLKEFAHVRFFPQALLISVFSWIVWNSFKGTGAINTFVDFSTNLIESLLSAPAEVAGTEKILVGYTQNYRSIIDIRLGLTLAVFLSAVLFAVIALRCVQHRRASVILVGWIGSCIFTSVPWLYAGLPYFSRPVTFTFIAAGPLWALVYNILSTKGKSRIHTKMKSLAAGMFLVAFVIVPSLLVPITKYSPLPFLYTTGRELTSKSFLDLHWSGDTEVIYFDYKYITHPFSWLLYGSNTSIRSVEIYSIYSPNEGLDPNIVNRSALWVTYKPVTRDAFWNYDPSYLQVVENVTQLLPRTTHNKVYDSGWPECILLPRNGSP